MIDKRMNTLNGQPITQWVVWFRTYEGLFKTPEEAAESASRTELPPELIKAVPVALDDNGNYEESP